MIRRSAAFWAVAWLGLAGTAYADVTLTVTSLEGGRDVDFGDLRSLGPDGEPEADTAVRRVRLTVASTSSGTYKVFMRVNEPWKNLSGGELAMEKVQFFVSEASAGATARFPNPTPMSLGEQEILFFQNEPAGTTTSVVTYTLPIPVGQQAGNYRTTLSFRVVSQ